MKVPERFGLGGAAEAAKDAGFVDPLEVGYKNTSNIVSKNSDPYVTYYKGKYYQPFLAWGNLYISSFDTLEGMTTDGVIGESLAEISFDSVGSIPDNARNNVWAPELHFVDGYWYVYYSASDSNPDNRRTYVLKSKTDNPLGEYEFAGQIVDSTNKWAASGTVFKYKGGLYYLWSGWEGNINDAQNIYIAKMSSPTTLSSERICIAIPYYDWEKRGAGNGYPMVNDAPAVISSGDYLSIIYSASGSWTDDYCMGQLLYIGGDVLDPTSWYKVTSPILKTDPVYDMYAPGNACITTDEKGVLWMIFHANTVAGDSQLSSRSTWKYPIRVKEDGVVEVLYGVKTADFKDPYVTGFTPMNNPIRTNAPDPHIACHDGKYYWIGNFLGSLFVVEMDIFDEEHLYDLVTNNLFTYEKVKFIGLEIESMDQYTEVWAPEIHFINGCWYVYFSAIYNGNRRMFVSKAENNDGYIGGKYTRPIQITDPTNKWGIDGSVFEYKGEMYYIWSGWEGDVNVRQDLYIAKMSDPMTISSQRVLLSIPWYGWEQDKGTMPENPTVNEGPVAITSGDYLTIVYSASGSWCDGYCLGQLVFQGGDILNVNNWYKHPQPILQTIPGKFYGPGHNCFVTDENGVMWAVFHAKTVGGTTGWDERHTFMYPIRINENGIIEVVLY